MINMLKLIQLAEAYRAARKDYLYTPGIPSWSTTAAMHRAEWELLLFVENEVKFDEELPHHITVTMEEE